jgi:hypothetical protein
MEFQLHNSKQSAAHFHELKFEMYKLAYEGSKKTAWIRVVGPLVAFGSAINTVAAKISAVAETIIKGFANIFGSVFSKKCKFFNGMKQIFVKLPMNVLALAFTPVEVVVGSAITIGSFLVLPEKYSEERAGVHQFVGCSVRKWDDAETLTANSLYSSLLFA